MFRKVLVANRGEIAVRIVRACREMGLASVAVFSEADRLAPHVRLADEAFCLGPAPVAESYMNADRLFQIARQAGADAIHPGYGFFAESVSFSTRCQEAGLAFVGQPAAILKTIGRKTETRRLMQSGNIPIVPGMISSLRNEAEAYRTAAELGYPVLLKPVTGGSGKGIRVAWSEADLHAALAEAEAEARAHFGEAVLYVEKMLRPVRHIEVGVLADNQGEAIYLPERECSIQRRHQKLLEESPSLALSGEQRRELGERAVQAVRLAGIAGAATVEFLVTADRAFYFLEMNSRVQTAHPVTEMVTGIDIIKEQFRLASGERLRWKQRQVHLRGAAIECRLYAEDPAAGFLPTVGTIGSYKEPGGPGVRVDSGVYPGMSLGIDYSPLLAKLIVWGSDREEAIARMRRALAEYVVSGVSTTVPFHRFVIDSDLFRRGEYNTRFVDAEWGQDGKRVSFSLASVAALAAALGSVESPGDSPPRRPSSGHAVESHWKTVARRDSLRRTL
jgi:acetyl-CoA carboxylase, biotin carboxylase subunit